jgi:hypothetical protein
MLHKCREKQLRKDDFIKKGFQVLKLYHWFLTLILKFLPCQLLKYLHHIFYLHWNLAIIVNDLINKQQRQMLQLSPVYLHFLEYQ